jgi:hypothetical protein
MLYEVKINHEPDRSFRLQIFIPIKGIHNLKEQIMTRHLQRTTFRLLVITLLLALLAAAPSMAALNLAGTKFMEDVAPGQTVSFPMILSTASSDSPADLEISVLGFGNGPDGRYQGLDPAQDTTPYSARSYITLDKYAVQIAPGGKETVTATIAVPANAGSGGRYALINIHTKPLGGGAVALVTAINVPIMITLKGAPVTETGTIESVNVGEIIQGKPLTVTTAFTNSGNHHYYGIKNEVTVSDSSGRVLAQGVTSPLATAVVPGGKPNFVNVLNTNLDPGTYTVVSRVINNAGTEITTKSASFTVSTAHAAAQEPVSITLTPDNTATLATSDGSISIFFPKGSVLGATTVTLTPSPKGTLPSPHEGIQLAKTSFAVDGFTGLLPQEASVTVKYSADDLTSAGGNANKLGLARYDSQQGSWTVLPTGVDTGKQVLTASTNHFSTWSVVVTSGGAAPSGNTGTKTTYSPLSSGIVITALFVTLCFLVMRKQS